MRQIAWPNIPGKLDEAWRRFRALSWRWKAPALSVAALCALGAALLVVAVAGGGAGDDTPLAGGETPSSGPTESPPPTSPPTPTATPPPPAVDPPVEGAYELVQALPSATFDQMLGFYVIPGEAAAVVITKDGMLRKVPLNGGAATPFGDISDRLVNATESEEGLLGLAFSPNFPADGRVYLYYTTGSPGPSVLSRFQVVDGALDTFSEQVLLGVPQPFANHNGGQLAFGPDGYLYLALGDGGAGGDPQGNGQDLSTLLGAILRLDVSGDDVAVPADNPFVGVDGARPEIYAYGLRNPWRFSFDRATRDIWAADVGQNRWEEVDRIIAGRNYGWNIMEGFECFSPPENCPTGGLELPRAVYSREGGCSVTGGYVYRGPSMPELDGWYVYGDFCSGKIWAVNTVGSAAPVLLADTGLPIASFGELPDGELVVVTFANAVYRLARSS